MPNEDDLGSRALKDIADFWRVNAANSVWCQNGFDWWPGDFRVSVRAHRRQDNEAPETWWLRITTDFLKDVPVDDARFISLAAVTSRFLASTYAWVYPSVEVWAEHGEKGSRPRLWFSSSAYVTSANVDWLPSLLARMSIMQPINAQIQAKGMPEMLFGGLPDISRPESLRRTGFDEILEMAAQVYVPMGRDESRWIGAGEFSKIAEKWGRSNLCFGNGDAHGLTLETSIGEDSALIRLRTEEGHPQLGHGLLVTLQLPYFAESKAVNEQCAFLNYMESLWTDFPQLGCWHPHGSREDQDGLAFSSFIPNALYQPGIATHAALWMLQRVGWVHDLMWPDLEDQPIEQILSRRLSLDSEEET